MLKNIKKSLIMLLILTMVFTVGCGDDEKKTTESKNSSTTSSSSQSDASSKDTSAEQTDSSTNSTTSSSTDTSSTGSTSSSGYNPPSSSHIDLTTKAQAETYKKAVTTILNCIKYGDYPTVKKSVIFEEDQQYLGFDESTIKRVKKILGYINYEITSAKYITDYEAQVTVKMSALDFEAIFKAYMKKAIELTHSGKEYTEKQLNKKLDQAFNTCFNVKAKTVSKKVTIYIVKAEDGWKIRDSLSFAQACLGGADSIYSVIQAAGEEETKE